LRIHSLYSSLSSLCFERQALSFSVLVQA
jgi:hypothetical protein